MPGERYGAEELYGTTIGAFLNSNYLTLENVILSDEIRDAYPQERYDNCVFHVFERSFPNSKTVSEEIALFSPTKDSETIDPRDPIPLSMALRAYKAASKQKDLDCDRLLIPIAETLSHIPFLETHTSWMRKKHWTVLEINFTTKKATLYDPKFNLFYNTDFIKDTIQLYFPKMAFEEISLWVQGFYDSTHCGHHTVDILYYLANQHPLKTITIPSWNTHQNLRKKADQNLKTPYQLPGKEETGEITAKSSSSLSEPFPLPLEKTQSIWRTFGNFLKKRPIVLCLAASFLAAGIVSFFFPPLTFFALAGALCTTILSTSIIYFANWITSSCNPVMIETLRKNREENYDFSTRQMADRMGETLVNEKPDDDFIHVQEPKSPKPKPEDPNPQPTTSPSFS